MNENLISKLVNDFPDFFRLKDISESDTLYICIGDGWFDIVYNMCKELDNINFNGYIFYIKEKFGSMRVFAIRRNCNKQFYGNYLNSDEHDIVNKAEVLSSTTCEVCGCHTTMKIIHGWKRCICKSCLFIENL